MVDFLWNGWVTLAIAGLFGIIFALSRRFVFVPVFFVALEVVRNPLSGFVQTNIGSVNVYFGDFVSVLLIALVISHIGRLRQLDGSLGLAAALFVILAAISWLRGLGVFGLQTATNEFRGLLYVIVAVAWGVIYLLSRPEAGASLQRAITSVAWLTTVWLIVRNVIDGGPTFTMRAEEAALLSVSAIIYFLRWIEKRSGHDFLTFVVLSAIMLVSVQRTATFALIVALLITVLLARGLPRFGPLISSLGIGAAMLGIWFSNAAAGRGRDPLEPQNWDWRVSSWEVLLQQYRDLSVIQQLIGQPMGSGWERQILIGGGTVSVSPHNMYLTLLLRVGAIGLALYVVVLLWALSRAVRAGNALGIAGVAYAAVYGIGYQIMSFIGLFLAFALVSSAQLLERNQAPSAVGHSGGERVTSRVPNSR